MSNSTPVYTAAASEPAAAPGRYQRGGESSAQNGLGGESLSQHRRRVSSANEYNNHQSHHAPCGWYFADDPELIRLIARLRSARWAIKGGFE
jgi:hypothetical protein